MKLPETTNLVPMTYAEALDLFQANGRRPFSFLVKPYLVLKTVKVMKAGTVVAAPPGDWQHVR
jgi:hypothetical protein